MTVRIAFWLAARLQNATLWLLDYGCRHSTPPVDLATEMTKQLLDMTTVVVMSPDRISPDDWNANHAVSDLGTKH